MSEPIGGQFFEALLTTLDPLLNNEAKKSLRAFHAILGLFPGQSLGDIEKNIKALLASSSNHVPALAERARTILRGQSSETADALAQVVGKLPSDQLKQLAKALELALAGTKAKMVEDFRVWLESGGRIAPLTKKDKVLRKAREYARDYTERMRSLDARTADEIVARAEQANRDKELGGDGFKEFARLLGVTVDGTKPKMLKQFTDAVNRMAVSHGQTQF